MPDYGCNLDEAFQNKGPEEPEQPPKQKSKKKKSSSLAGVFAPPPPPEEYINFRQLGGDPDRQQYVRPKLVEAMNSKPAWFGSTDAVEPSDFMKSFNKTENFADYGGNDTQDIGADFMSAFKGRGVQKASAVPAPPIVDVWKPLTPSGAETSFFNYLPQLPETPPENNVNHDALQRRLRSIYERLDLLETARRDNAQTEVMLFVVSGVFFLFSLDLLTRISK